MAQTLISTQISTHSSDPPIVTTVTSCNCEGGNQLSIVSRSQMWVLILLVDVEFMETNWYTHNQDKSVPKIWSGCRTLRFAMQEKLKRHAVVIIGWTSRLISRPDWPLSYSCLYCIVFHVKFKERKVYNRRRSEQARRRYQRKKQEKEITVRKPTTEVDNKENVDESSEPPIIIGSHLGRTISTTAYHSQTNSAATITVPDLGSAE